MLETGLETQSALLQLALLLVAQSHVIEYFNSDHLVSLARRDIHMVQHTMGFLQQQHRFVKLLSRYVSKCAFVQLEQHDWDFIYRNIKDLEIHTLRDFKFLIIVFIEGFIFIY